MRSFLKLIRPLNLLLIIFTQWSMRQLIIIPILQVFGFDASISTGPLWLLIFSTVCIAAGGYILNDYFDMKIDTINRPEDRIVGLHISREKTMWLYQIMTGIGLTAGLVLSFLCSSFTLAFTFIIITGLLWFYSASYKRQFVTGNIIVAFMASMTILIVALTEIALLEKNYDNLIYQTPIPGKIYIWIGAFSFFAFLCTWIREIIKDIEDEPGDRELECRTMPIKWGIAKTKLFLYALTLLTVALLYIAALTNQTTANDLTIKYISIGITLPFIVLLYFLVTAKNISDYRQAATILKFIMLTGTLYSFLFYYQLAKTTGINMFNIFVIK